MLDDMCGDAGHSLAGASESSLHECGDDRRQARVALGDLLHLRARVHAMPGLHISTRPTESSVSYSCRIAPRPQEKAIFAELRMCHATYTAA